MAANGIIALVKDRTRVDTGLRGSENVLHDPSFAIAERDNQRRDPRIGADDIDAVEFGGRGDTFGVDDEVAVGLGPEEAAEAFVADQRFVALVQGLFQSGQGRGARGGIVARFRLIIANDVAATPGVALTCLDLANDFLDLKIERTAANGLGNCQRYERGLVGDYGGDFDAALFTHTQNILDLVGFERGDGLGADHAAIGDDADAIELETLAQPRDDGYECRDIGCIARPHLTTDRSPGLIDDDAKDHLMQIGAGVFGMIVAAERGSAVTLEIEARGIEDRQPDIIEEAAAPGEQLLLDQILVGAGHQAASLLVGKFFAEPGHRPVQVILNSAP